MLRWATASKSSPARFALSPYWAVNDRTGRPEMCRRAHLCSTGAQESTRVVRWERPAHHRGARLRETASMWGCIHTRECSGKLSYGGNVEEYPIGSRWHSRGKAALNLCERGGLGRGGGVTVAGDTCTAESSTRCIPPLGAGSGSAAPCRPGLSLPLHCPRGGGRGGPDAAGGGERAESGEHRHRCDGVPREQKRGSAQSVALVSKMLDRVVFWLRIYYERRRAGSSRSSMAEHASRVRERRARLTAVTCCDSAVSVKRCVTR